VHPVAIPEDKDEVQPTRWSALVFHAKANVLRLRRLLKDPHGRPTPLPLAKAEAQGPLIAESRTPLFPSGTGAEFALQAGKVQNLRIAARHLNGRQLRAGNLFSFWAHIPRPTASRGFALGRELRSGCVIPSVGGGLCQLSNALYGLALDAGWEIVERHAHTRTVPGTTVPPGRDATIFWNYVDLRFRPNIDCQLSVEVLQTELHVQLRALGAGHFPMVPTPSPAHSVEDADTCETCGVTSCFRHPTASALPQQGSTAWLVDSWMPEHAAYLTRTRQPQDSLLTPLNNAGPYRWRRSGFASVHTAPSFVAWRSLVSRRLGAQGAARQRALLDLDQKLATIYARKIPVTALHLVVSQNLLPFLWTSGVLAGRTFDVLMTRLPFASLQAQLDRAAERWPDTPTLADFRADPALVQAESAALAAARHWVTPHTDIARLGSTRSILLDWQQPSLPRQEAGNSILFPASTLARKGARDLREALSGLDLPLTLCGPLLEGDEFWKGHQVQRAGKDWTNDAALVVLPAWVEHQPRRLLAALAAGIPVICTRSCGLPPQPGLSLIEEGDSASLRAAIRSIVDSSTSPSS
jgi:hypothetical protein